MTKSPDYRLVIGCFVLGFCVMFLLGLRLSYAAGAAKACEDGTLTASMKCVDIVGYCQLPDGKVQPLPEHWLQLNTTIMKGDMHGKDNKD